MGSTVERRCGLRLAVVADCHDEVCCMGWGVFSAGAGAEPGGTRYPLVQAISERVHLTTFSWDATRCVQVAGWIN